jgi:hypothetical protein
MALDLSGNPFDGLGSLDSKLAWQISKNYETMVTAEQVAFLKQEFSYGEVVLIFGLADASGKPVSAVYSLCHNGNHTWRQLALNLGVNINDVSPKVGSVLRSLSQDAEYTALKAKLETAAVVAPVEISKPANPMLQTSPNLYKHQ